MKAQVGYYIHKREQAITNFVLGTKGMLFI